MKTGDNHLQRVNQLFIRVADLEPVSREAVLVREGEHDPDLVKEVRELLNIDASSLPGNITKAIEAAKIGAARGPADELVGRTLGAYKLTSILGRGGSGTVYLGERAEKQFSARVAIKVVATALVNNSLLARFTSEQQILSTLEHQNIAKLLDVGESEEGYPYLVMEYVHGVAIDRFADENTLSIEDRIRIFLRVCAAVQYAHKNLVVHRDLKPGNILVTDSGNPKLLDFGIAKLLATTGQSTALTRLNDRALTPDYASPEQIAGQAITTASDVYSLGIVLYELLSGLRPYYLQNAAPLELERMICFTDPPKPSVAVERALEKSSPHHPMILSAASARGISPNKVRETLLGDLDAIIMRALRKEPDKRYASVEALAADCERYLSHEPVEARHGNWMYYASRFCRRHTVPVVATTVVAATLMVTTVTSSVLYQRVRSERDHAERLSTLLSAVFQDANPYASNGEQVTARELLDTASQRVGQLHDDPEVQGKFLAQIGAAYLSIGNFDAASEHLNSAAQITKQLHPEDKAGLARLLAKLATAERAQGKIDAAEHDFNEAQALLRETRADDSEQYADLLRAMGRLEHSRGELKAAEKYYLDAIAISRRLNKRPLDVAVSLRELSALYNWMNKLPEAEASGRDALAIFEKELPERHPDRVLAQLELGNVYFEERKIDLAAGLIDRSVQAQRNIYRNSGPELAQSLSFLAQVREAQGRDEEAEALLRESVDDAERAFGPTHFQSGYYRTSLGKFLVKVNRNREAAEQLRRALTVYEHALPKTHQYVASTQYWLGEALIGAHQPREAIVTLQTALKTGQESKAPAWLVARTESALGEALAQTGSNRDAREHLEHAYRSLRQERGVDDEATKLAQSRLENFNRHRG